MDNHHKAPVTCVECTPDGTKLFSGDSEGNVAISVLNMDNVSLEVNCFKKLILLFIVASKLLNLSCFVQPQHNREIRCKLSEGLISQKGFYGQGNHDDRFDNRTLVNGFVIQRTF